ncbi:MAG: hypothetical protein ABW023_06405 [Sphingomonas sp.]
MPSFKTITAVRVARSLKPAEMAINDAAIEVLAVGTEVLRARVSGAFGLTEGQVAVDQIGRATTLIFSAISEMAQAHGSLRQVAEDHEILGYGDLCPAPEGRLSGMEGNVTPLHLVG